MSFFFVLTGNLNCILGSSVADSGFPVSFLSWTHLPASDSSPCVRSDTISLNFIDDQEIQLEHLGVASQVNAWDPVSEEVVLEALEVILNPRNYPLIIMCNLGRHRTGLFFVCHLHLFEEEKKRPQAVREMVSHSGI